MSFNTIVKALIILVLAYSASVQGMKNNDDKRLGLYKSCSSIKENREKIKMCVDHNKRERLTKTEALGSIMVMSAVVVRLILYAYDPDNISLAKQIGVDTALCFGAFGGAMKGCLGAQRVSELKEWIVHCWKNTSSYSESYKRMIGSKYGKKEVFVRSMLALFGVWVSVSAGLDGFRIIKKAMLDYGKIGGVFMGMPEIFSAIFNSVESGYLFAIKSRHIEASKGACELSEVPVIPVILNEGEGEEKGSPYIQEELHSNQVVDIENDASSLKISAHLEKHSPNKGAVYQVELSNTKGEKVVAFLVAGGSSYFLISIEQLTFLYIMFPENLWLSHAINMLGMGGHLIADYFVGYTNILALTNCLKKSAKSIFKKCSSKNKKYKLSVIQSNDIDDSNASPYDNTVGWGELPADLAKAAIKHIEETDKQNKQKSSRFISYCSNVGAFVIITGFGWSEGYYQWSLSNEVKDCVMSVASLCAEKGVVMSSVMSNTTAAWADFSNTTGELVANSELLAQPVGCPIATDICSASQQSFYQYATASSFANKYLAGATALKALIFIQELDTVKHFFRRAANTLFYPVQKIVSYYSKKNKL